MRSVTVERSDAPLLAALRRFQLDHIGAEVAQQLARPLPFYVAELQDTQAPQGAMTTRCRLGEDAPYWRRNALGDGGIDCLEQVRFERNLFRPERPVVVPFSQQLPRQPQRVAKHPHIVLTG